MVLEDRGAPASALENRDDRPLELRWPAADPDMTAIPRALEGRRVLFVSYNGMLDPLGQSQVIPYLRELAKRGVRFTLLSFERAPAFEPPGRVACNDLQQQLAADNIDWHWLPYHQKPSLPATAYDVWAGIRYATRLVKQNGIEMVHARGYIPATIALALKKRFALKLIFDIRGLMAEEYFDAEHWSRNSIPYRLTKAMERRALSAADGVVTLTEKIWPIIKEWEGLRGREVIHEVVPCCADLELFKFRQEDRDRRRKELGVGERFVLVYSGSIDGWYLTEPMADFFAEVLRRRPDAHFLWLLPSGHRRVETLMQDRGVAPGNYTLLAASSRDVPSYLSASDVGLALIKPCFSKLASSPTKTAEYLACGLPIIMNAGIGDSDSLIIQENVGALIHNFEQQDYARAVVEIESFAGQAEQTRRRARATAAKLFDLRVVGIKRYTRLYEKVLGAMGLNNIRK
jgi:glycosyltransferase involved in cell wall biosynthesis